MPHLYPQVLGQPESCLQILYLLQVYLQAQNQQRLLLINKEVQHPLTPDKFLHCSTHYKQAWPLVMFCHQYLHLIQVVMQLLLLPHSLHFSLLLRYIYHLSVPDLHPLYKQQCHQHNLPVLPQLYPQDLSQQVYPLRTLYLKQFCLHASTHNSFPVITLSVRHRVIIAITHNYGPLFT